MNSMMSLGLSRPKPRASGTSAPVRTVRSNLNKREAAPAARIQTSFNSKELSSSQNVPSKRTSKLSSSTRPRVKDSAKHRRLKGKQKVKDLAELYGGKKTKVKLKMGKKAIKSRLKNKYKNKARPTNEPVSLASARTIPKVGLARMNLPVKPRLPLAAKNKRIPAKFRFKAKDENKYAVDKRIPIQGCNIELLESEDTWVAGTVASVEKISGTKMYWLHVLYADGRVEQTTFPGPDSRLPEGEGITPTEGGFEGADQRQVAIRKEGEVLLDEVRDEIERLEADIHKNKISKIHENVTAELQGEIEAEDGVVSQLEADVQKQVVDEKDADDEIKEESPDRTRRRKNSTNNPFVDDEDGLLDGEREVGFGDVTPEWKDDDDDENAGGDASYEASLKETKEQDSKTQVEVQVPSETLDRIAQINMELAQDEEDDDDNEADYGEEMRNMKLEVEAAKVAADTLDRIAQINRELTMENDDSLNEDG